MLPLLMPSLLLLLLLRLCLLLLLLCYYCCCWHCCCCFFILGGTTKQKKITLFWMYELFKGKMPRFRVVAPAPCKRWCAPAPCFSYSGFPSLQREISSKSIGSSGWFQSRRASARQLQKNQIGLFPRTLLRVHSSCSPPVPVASIFGLRGGCAAGFRCPISVTNFIEDFVVDFSIDFFHGFLGWAWIFFWWFPLVFLYILDAEKNPWKNPWKNSWEKSLLKSMGQKKTSMPNPKSHAAKKHGEMHANPFINPWAKSMRARDQKIKHDP